MYALVLLVGESRGRFRDRLGTDRRVAAGDLIVVFPSVGHQYGPEADDHWEEIFVAFEGPAFDAWMSHGLSTAHPVRHVGPSPDWIGRFSRILAPTAQEADACHRVAEIHSLIADLLATPTAGTADDRPRWLDRACHALSRGAGAASLQEVAALVGLGYDGFRHAFKAATGETPHRYRSRMRASRAALLLQRSDLKLEAIARSLGYYDAFHFSKAFRSFYQCSPSDFRRKTRPPSGPRTT